MTRIVLIPSAYLPSLGGVEEVTRHLALSLREMGDIVEVWTGTEDSVSPPSVVLLDGITVRRFPMPLPTSNARAALHFPMRAIQSVRVMSSAARIARPDLFHVVCFGPNGAYGMAIAQMARRPLVVSLHGETFMDDHDIFERSWFMRRSLSRALKHAAVVTACSRFTLTDAEERFGLHPDRGQVLFNAVTIDPPSGSTGCAPNPLLEEVGDRPYVFALGRVVEKKGFDLLLRAFALVAERHPEVILAVGGEGDALPALRRLAGELGLEARVRFGGRLSRTQVAEALAGANVLIVPSRVEPFGIVILEGWRAGIPVVATNRGGPPEFVRDGHDGILVDPFDTPAMARVLDRLLADPAERSRIGEAGRERVVQFAWPETAAHYRALYTSVLATGHPSGGR